MMAFEAGREAWQPYPLYRDSDVDWLGEIPSHWSIRRLKHACHHITDGSHFSPETQAEGKPYVTVRDIAGMSIDFENAAKISEEDFAVLEHNGCRPKIGDVLLSKDGTIGKAVVADCDDFVVLSSLAILRPADYSDSRYLRYFLLSKMGIEQMLSWIAGAALRRMTLKVIVNLVTMAPPLREQRAISDFLDRETAKIDALVVKMEQLIALLEEKRTALISHAVTKGLVPSVPMIDSGVEWLGQIPAHWEIAPLWTLFRLGRGRVISHEEIHEQPGPYPVYSSQTEAKGVMGTIDTYDFDGTYLTWTTDGAHAGTVFYREGKFNCTNVCGTMMSERQDVFLEFFCHAVNRATDWFVRHDINPKLMNNVMAGIRVQKPSLDEQMAIAEYIDAESESIAQIVNKVEGAIAKLNEYRTALISAAVTGKIDVRREV